MNGGRQEINKETSNEEKRNRGYRKIVQKGKKWNQKQEKRQKGRMRSKNDKNPLINKKAHKTERKKNQLKLNEQNK